ncbi:MAG: tetratricopeptide repeat protein [Salibacteraceae bacterium]
MKVFYALLFVAFTFFACEQTAKNGNESEVTIYNNEYDSLSAIIKKDLNNSELYQARAYWLRENNRYKEALGDINRAIKLDSLKGQYYVDKAEMLIDQNEIGKAKAFLDDAIYTTPGSTEIMLKTSEIYLWAGDYQKTIDWANAALKFDNYLAQAYYLKGLAHEYSKDTLKAVTSLQTAVEQDPNHYSAFMQLGKLFSIANHVNTDAYYTNAISIKPESIEAYYARGLFRQNNGLPQKAIEDYNSILELEENHVAANYNIGYVQLILLEQPDSAISFFETAASIEPEYADATYMLGYCFELQSKYPEALSKYRETLKIKDTHTLAAMGVNRLENL